MNNIRHHRSIQSIMYCARAICHIKRIWWSEDQYSQLISLYGKISNKELSKIIGKPISQIVSMAKTKGLSKKQKIWSDDRLAILDTKFPEIGYKVLDLLPGLTYQQVKSKATERKLKIKLRGKRIKYLLTGIIYNSIAQAVKDTGKSKSDIISHAQGKFKNSEWEYVD